MEHTEQITGKVAPQFLLYSIKNVKRSKKKQEEQQLNNARNYIRFHEDLITTNMKLLDNANETFKSNN